MSQREFLADLDADLHAAFAEAGMADVAAYTPPGGVASGCSVYCDREMQPRGQFGQVRAPINEVAYILGSMTVAPAQHGVLVVDGQTLINAKEISNDGSLSRWMVRNG